MKYQVLAVLAAAVSVVAQGVTDNIAPKDPAPAGCKPNVDGKFEVSIVVIGKNGKRDAAIQKRGACAGDGILVAQMKDGVITDAHQRKLYVASNYQLQFDGPPQAGAIFTAGFSYCQNGSLALGGSTVFYQCRSGNFYNLYDRYWAEQCEAVEIIVMPCGGAEAPTGSQTGNHIIGTQIITTTVVIPLSDGQPQVLTTTLGIPICQIGDGQIQGHTTPCASLPVATPTQPAMPPPVSEYSDGQIQVTPVPVSQFSDGQIQVTPVPEAPNTPSPNTPSSPAPTAPSPSQSHSTLQTQSTLQTPSSAPPVPTPTAPTPTAPTATGAAPAIAVAGGLVGEMAMMAVVGAVAWGM